MDANYETALRAVLVHEGGRVDAADDPGGRTAYGITFRVYAAYRKRRGLPVTDVYGITAEEIVAIYRTQYWNAIKANVLPDGLDYCVFDGAVNSGPVQSIKWLQRALGPSYTGSVDGQMGQFTLDAVETHPDIDALIANYCQRRLLFLKALKTWPRFGKGWQARVSNVQRVAQAQASGTVGPTPIFTAGGNKKAEVRDAIKAPTTVLGDASAGSGFTLTSMSGLIDQAKAQIEPYANAIPKLETVLGGLAVLGVVLMGAGGVWAWYARRKAAHLADALDTRPRQLVAPAAASEEDPNANAA
jgi:lysozyme family protein